MHFLSIITRYLNEPFIDEFVEYYLSEGVDCIYILFDTDSTVPIPDVVSNNPQVKITNSTNFKKKQTFDANVLYKRVQKLSEWAMFIDCDEFITTRKHAESTIANELHTIFQDVDCVKIPWVMMSSGKRKHDPVSILQKLTWRWNHDIKHPHQSRWIKGRCRYDQIEVKCIFRCSKFSQLNLHHPSGYTMPPICVDGVYRRNSVIDPYYNSLRECDIQFAYMVCYHYRIFSLDSAKRKMVNNKLDNYVEPNLRPFLQSDYSDIKDNYLSDKSIARFGKK